MVHDSRFHGDRFSGCHPGTRHRPNDVTDGDAATRRRETDYGTVRPCRRRRGSDGWGEQRISPSPACLARRARLGGYGVLFQRASIRTGFAWLTAMSAPAVPGSCLSRAIELT
jgi:hypothetical protein